MKKTIIQPNDMDISQASTEAFARYHKFHEQFNSTVQVALAGMVTLRRLVDAPNGQYIMSSVVRSIGMPWPVNPRTRTPTTAIDKAITIAAQMAVVEALSAFDSFTLDLATNLAQFSVKARTKGPFKHAHTSVICDHSQPAEFCVCCYACAIQYGDNHRFATRIEDLTADLNITDVAATELLPMFHYFRLARNSIVHVNGRASEEFSDYSQTPALGISVGYWNKVTRKAAPDLPKPALGAPIPFTMAHAIWRAPYATGLRNR